MTFKYAGITEQAKAATKRLADAKRLLQSGREHERGAMYLAGYAIECRIKAIAMELHECVTLKELAEKLNLKDEDVFSHRLERMLRDLLSSEIHQKLTESRQTQSHWRVVNKWTPQWRYDRNTPDPEEASRFVQSIEKIHGWLGSNV